MSGNKFGFCGRFWNCPLIQISDVGSRNLTARFHIVIATYLNRFSYSLSLWSNVFWTCCTVQTEVDVCRAHNIQNVVILCPGCACGQHTQNTVILCISNTGWGRTVSIAHTTWYRLLGVWTLTIITRNIFHVQLKFLTHCAQTEYRYLLPGILAQTALNTSYKDPNTWIWEIQKYNLFFKQSRITNCTDHSF